MLQQHSRLSNSDDDSGCALEEYAWCPSGLKAEQVRQFFKCFPEDKVPFLNSIGEKYRTKMLEEQLPPHDSDPKYCRTLTEDERNELKIFNEQQRHNALGRGSARQLPLTQSPMPCRGCQNLIDSGSICVFAERAGRAGLWHPQCFTCKQCNEFLVNLIYFYKDGQLYCGRHHAELYKPRCTGCDEIIFSDECTEAEGYSWHMDHFCCSNCKKRLGGERYVMRQSQSFCLNCFETMYAEYCDTCGERIETDQPQMAHESQHWHATDTCFYCYTCRIPLHNRGFFPRYGALFCSNECASQRNNRLINTKLNQQNKFHQSPDIIPTSYSYTNQHVKIIPARSKINNRQQTTSNRRTKEPTGYVSDGAGVQKYKRDYTNGYLSDGTSSRRYNRHQPQVFLQYQTSPDSTLTNDHHEQQKLNITRSRSREPIQFYNDLNLEQLDRHGATLEIARCSASKSSHASLPDLSYKSISKPKVKTYPTISQETLVDQPTTRLKNFDSNEIMYPISRPKSTAYSTMSAQFPRSRSLNGSTRFTKQHHVRFVDDHKEKVYKRSPTMSYRSKKNVSTIRRSSSSSSSDDDEQDDFNSIYQQFDIHGNRIKKSMNYGTKISYVDECAGLRPNTINPTLMKKSTTLNKKDKKSNEVRRKKDCIIS
ncbi:unnamed protein product [Rotaria magnacalcarata]|uniref:Uncharacterized protein n=9 Tax=Rotaria magnacalcarata TaxID=392030 RepID=A0A816SXR3_9BILA|nr:unnamed protein product [Rotaria magnacalcarata]CAF1547343.1 unnamed protein product [Rotaria magnacalcarata]CAF2093711.1 unnamed protein product [Rotaria magnacalcarata]CAF2113942.1 unnamed protein product [Rotaria magnacalcarata]CAF2160623.1 unnamed protein product [Rotaria magnacalcarata]